VLELLAMLVLGYGTIVAPSLEGEFTIARADHDEYCRDAVTSAQRRGEAGPIATCVRWQRRHGG
jgi:hypothetical protein